MTEPTAEAKIEAIEDVVAVLDCLFPEEKTATDFIAWLKEREADIERRAKVEGLNETLARERWRAEREHNDIIYHFTHKRYEDL